MVAYDRLSTVRIACVAPGSTTAFAKVKGEEQQTESKETAILARGVAQPL